MYYAEYRYPSFFPWLNDDDTSQEKCIIKDYIIKRLEYLDKNREITLNNYQIHQKKLELINGMYGEKIQTMVRKLSDDKVMILASGLVKQQNGPSIVIYEKIVLSLIGQGALYQNNEDRTKLYLYIGRNYSLEDMELINLCNMLFLPWRYQVKLYWDDGMPVLGEECNTIGNVRL